MCCLLHVYPHPFYMFVKDFVCTAARQCKKVMLKKGKMNKTIWIPKHWKFAIKLKVWHSIFCHLHFLCFCKMNGFMSDINALIALGIWWMTHPKKFLLAINIPWLVPLDNFYVIFKSILIPTWSLNKWVKSIVIENSNLLQ